MSTPNGTRSRRRTAGLTLVALAVIAVLIGLVAVTCRQRNVENGPPLSTPPHPPGGGSVAPSVIPYPPPATSGPAEAPYLPPATGGPAEAPEITAPGPLEPAPYPPVSDVGQGKGEKENNTVEVRVYNNSTIRGLAARVARDLTAAGWTVVDVGNYPWGTIPTTTVYYQEGTGQHADAEAIGAKLGMRVLPRFLGIVNASPGLIVIVTNDYRR